MNTTTIDDLIKIGPNPKFHVRKRVQLNLEKIEKARGLGWGWQEITAAIGLEKKQWHSVWRDFDRLKKKGIK